jgi:RNA polymerase sigma factor (sigma-70 family)
MVESSRWDRGQEDVGLDQQMAAHDGLVHWVARRQRHGDLSFDEVVQAGRIGLWHALRGYDPSRGTRFSSYGVPTITHAIWDAVATRARESRLPIAGEPDGTVDRIDLSEGVDRTQRAVVVRTMVDNLPVRLRQVIVAHYGWDENAPQSFAQIGKLLGVSRQRVQQLHVQALLWLGHPAHSRSVRRLLERQQRPDYQRALARQRQHARAPRSVRSVGR